MHHDLRALNIMHKMGYEEGTGLGKNQDGILNPPNIAGQNGRRGFGTKIKIDCCPQNWNASVQVKEDLTWIYSFDKTDNCCTTWIKRGPCLTKLDQETNFCNENALHDVLRIKEEVFKNWNPVLLSRARTRANPFEAIKSAFFMNRAALKMANIDAVCDFMFTNVDKDPKHKQSSDPYYFADVCAGPGGFSEYILWRKKWLFKGFGFTLKAVHDFTLHLSSCASDATFRAYYGSAKDGNICNPDNILDFSQKVRKETDNKGVHFMMADGGFSVEGNEHIQEVLSKQLYICQCLMGLEIVRTNGHFVTKLFDVFTKFSVGLIFLMYLCFEKITIFKPNSSRPANSERYLICSSLKSSLSIESIKKHLWIIVKDLWEGAIDKTTYREDILEIVPLEIIQSDQDFFDFIKLNNETLAKRQTESLLKLAEFCKRAHLVDDQQSELRSQCLSFWRIPDRKREELPSLKPDNLLASCVSQPEFLYAEADKIESQLDLGKCIADPSDWIYVPLNSSRKYNNCYIFTGVNSSKVFQLHQYKWSRVRNLKLAKGTILYGELISEYDKTRTGKKEVRSLHVIDALKLGDTSLADLPFSERYSLIQTYCKAVNCETIEGAIQVRPKIFASLSTITDESIVNFDVLEDCHYSIIPHHNRKYFIVNSLLLLKNTHSQLFNTMYVLREQFFIDRFEKEADGDSNTVTYDDFLHYLRDFK